MTGPDDASLGRVKTIDLDDASAPLAPREQPGDDEFARRLRGFGSTGILAIVVVLAGNFIVAPLSSVLALLWARRSRTPWHEMGFLRPRNWLSVVVVGVVFGVAFKFLMKMIAMPLLGADPINHAYHFLAGNGPAALALVPELIIKAGFGEEILFRGYLFERFGKLIGRGTAARVATVVITSVFFGVLHYHDQGLAGAQQATIVGLVFGTVFAWSGRIWLLVIAHAAFDLAALAIIYWDLEATVAHLIFK